MLSLVSSIYIRYEQYLTFLSDSYTNEDTVITYNNKKTDKKQAIPKNRSVVREHTVCQKTNNTRTVHHTRYKRLVVKFIMYTRSNYESFVNSLN